MSRWWCRPIRDQRGSIFLIGLVLVNLVTLLALALFDLARIEGTLASSDASAMQALYCAEAALGRTMVDTAPGGRIDLITATLNAGPGGTRTFTETVTSPGGPCSNQVVFLEDLTVPGTPRRFLTATTAGQNGAQRTVRIQLNFLASPFEYAAVANAGDLTIRGEGAVPDSGPGGADIVNGDVFIHGNVFVGTPGSSLTQNAQINPFSGADSRPTVSITESMGFNLSDNSTAYPQLSPPDLNFFGYRPASERPQPNINGYVDAVRAAAGISGGNPAGNLTGTFHGSTVYNLKTIFDTLGTTSSGALQRPAGCSCGGAPTGNCQLYCRLSPLGLKRNPSDRSTENGDTPGDDYYFDGTMPGGELIPGKSGQRGARRLLDLAIDGQPAVFLVDGNARFHTRDSYGFAVNGRASIVATNDVVISDNLIYREGNSETNPVTADLLGLVAQRDVWFGDPRFGTFYEGSSVMLAGRDFNFVFFKTDGSCCKTPENAVTLNGTMLANRQIAVFRDWAHPTSQSNSCPAGSSACRPVAFDPRDTSCGSVFGCWRFLVRTADGSVSFDTSTASFRECLSESCASGTRRVTHYQMTINYETRLRTSAILVPPGLPTGAGLIFAGSWRDWQECPPCN